MPGSSEDQQRDPAHQPLTAAWEPDFTSDVDASSPHPPRRWPARFVRRYGWRAWALPVLAVLTVLAIVDTVHPRWLDVVVAGGDGERVAAAPSSPSGSAAGTTAAPSTSNPVASEAPRGGAYPTDVPSAQLPPGGDFPVTGRGSWHVVAGTSPRAGSAGRTFTYTVEVEDGITPPGGDDAFAHTVTQTLANPKSWSASPEVAMRRIDSGDPDFRVRLTAQQTSRELCGFSIPYDSSCHIDEGTGEVYINAARWERAAISFQGDIGLYRQYAVNHEVGHFLGNGHEACPGDGALAPVMMQQTFSTSNDELARITDDSAQGVQVPADGATCRPNAWPYPRAGQSGAEGQGGTAG